MQLQPAVSGNPKAYGRGIGKRGIATTIPAGGDAKPAFHCRVGGVELRNAWACFLPGRNKGVETFCDADTVKLLATDCLVPVEKRVAAAHVQPVDAKL